MFRFVALTWDAKNPDANLASQILAERLGQLPGWEESLRATGLYVFHVDARPGSSEIYVLPGAQGVVLGKLFKKEGGGISWNVDTSFTDEEAFKIIDSGGQRLVRDYWGRYVAFLRCHHAERVWVLRDPVGALPCYVTSFRSVSVYFSFVEDCIAIGILHFSLNWQYIAAYACYSSQIQTRETALNEVKELQPGECLELSAGQHLKKTLYWDPAVEACRDPIHSDEQAVEALRFTTKMCIEAWASCYPRILHLLSGGLDSSIVLMCLARSYHRPKVTCLTYFNSLSPAADERRFARLVAAAADCELIELEERVSETRLDTVLQIPRSVNPWLMQYYATHSYTEQSISRLKRTSAVFYGVGGDQIFFQGPLILIVADYVHRFGLTKATFRLATEVAGVTGLSVWSILRKAIKLRITGPHYKTDPYLGRTPRRLVPQEVVANVKRSHYLVHPWLVSGSGVPAGKREHIRMMSCSHDFYDPLASPDSPERVRPLVSQPLIELCLRIPTYILSAGGNNRIVARRAFSNEVPPEITWRYAKGVVDQYFHRLMFYNLELVRELMLDGLLVQHGLLDRAKLEGVISRKECSFGPEVAELVVHHLGTEAWLRRWSEVQKTNRAWALTPECLPTMTS